MGNQSTSICASVDDDNASALAKAKEVPSVMKALEGLVIVKAIYVKGKIVNIMAK